MSNDFLAKLCALGIMSSQAFVQAHEENDIVERFIRMLKEQLLWVRTFEELRVTLLDWLVAYNEEWLVERHRFRSPAQMRRVMLVTEVAA